MAEHVQSMLAFKAQGIPVVDYGNNIRQVALDEGVKNAFDFPGLRARLCAPPLLSRHRARSAGSRCRAIPKTSTARMRR